MSTLLLPQCLALSACGGGGDGGIGVASIPPPPPTPTPTPTPTIGAYPATSAGTYDLIGRLTVDPGTGIPADWINRLTTPGEFTMTIASQSNGALSYSLNGPSGLLPGARTSIDSGPAASWSTSSSGYTRGTFEQAPPFGAGTDVGVSLLVGTGYSYVSMGEWEWPVILTGNPTNATNFGELFFVNGDRTPASDIPASGTATYDAHSLTLLSSNGTPGIPFTLTADFGQRTIGTRIDQDFQNNDGVPGDPDLLDSSPVQGIHVGGNAPFSNDGSFDIPLSGTVNYSYQNLPAPPPSQAATGDMNGAFFGPNAEQVGGTFSLRRTTDQLPLYQDAFVGQQHPH